MTTPTAALSSFPYTPEESMKALRYFYEKKGNELWGPYGFYDAFSEEKNWVADGYLAIDQGPIISMIENHRTGLLWVLCKMRKFRKVLRISISIFKITKFKT